MKIKKLLQNKNFDVNANYKIYDTTDGTSHDDSPLIYSTLEDNHDIPLSVLKMEVEYITTEIYKNNGQAVGVIIIEARRPYEINTPAKYNIRSIIHGDYVATPIKNAFNNKTAYWLSKNRYTVAMYMFTVEDCVSEKDFEDRLTGVGYAELERMFEDKFEK